MRAEFTWDEAVMNQAVIGMGLYYENELKVIQYVKIEKNTRQVIVHCTDGDVFTTRQDAILEFEVNNKLILKKVTKKQLRGK